MKQRKLILLLLFFLALSSKLAAESGSLHLEKGRVIVRRNSVDTVYQKTGTTVPVQAGDEFQTGMNTRAKIKLDTKGNEIELYSLTVFRFDGSSKEMDDVSMFTGKSRFLIKKRQVVNQRKRRFRLRTGNALIGVKGTEFMVGCENGITNVLSLSGIVMLSNISAPEIAVELKVDHASQVNQDTGPTVPVLVSPDIRKEITSGDSGKGFEEIKYGDSSQLKQANETLNAADKTKVPDEETDVIDIEEQVDDIAESVDEVEEAVEEQQSDLQSIGIKIVN